MTDSPNVAVPPSPAALARQVLDANAYLTLATSDVDGRPWASAVWFAEREIHEFVWVSRIERRHSRNIAARPEVALAVFDSTTPVGSATAVYVDAIAAVVADEDVTDALAIFNGEADASGLTPWTTDQVTGSAPFRLFRAVTTEAWILDEHENRIRVR